MKFLLRKANKAFKIWQTDGVRGVRERIKNLIAEKSDERRYRKWIKKHDSLTDADRHNMRQEIENFSRRPLISIVLPVYNVEGKWLRLCVESVFNQIYENWELCIADDCSPSPHVRKILEEYAAKDKRVKVFYRAENGHISAASNSALELATGEFAALLDHDDEFSEQALFHVVAEINRFPDADLIYSDEDMTGTRGRRFQPRFRPDWSREFFYSLNLITHLAVYRTEIMRRVGGFRIGYEGSQDYDLALRFTEVIPENHIRHIPRILYHWRAIPGSVALNSDEKPYAPERARAAITSHFERTGVKATVSQTVHNFHRVRYALPEDLPKVSLILSADEDLEFKEKTIANLIGETDYKDLQTIKVAGGKQSEAERLNAAATEAGGEILCFIDANLKPLSKDWLKELVSFACQKEIGATGAKLLYADETILHGGLIIGAAGAVGIAHHHLPRTGDGNFLRARLVNNFSAVSISCLAVRRDVFESVGGFDAKNFPNKLFDADFCLRLREKNYRIVFTPYAELIQIEKNRLMNLQKIPTAEEKNYFAEKWKNVICRDPFYNPNLSYKSEDFSIDV